jgi:hypothetical protein
LNEARETSMRSPSNSNSALGPAQLFWYAVFSAGKNQRERTGPESRSEL